MVQVTSPRNPKTSIYEALKLLFYVSALIGILPYSIPTYFRSKRFKLSWIACVWCVFNTLNLAVHYHYSMAGNFTKEVSTGTVPKSNILTATFGTLTIYMEPAMMCFDVLAAIINQRKFIKVFERLQRVQSKLEIEGIEVDYRVLTKLGQIFVAIVFFMEYLLITLNFFEFTSTLTIDSFYYFLSGLPLLLNAIAKLWFILLILIIRQILQKINNFLNENAKIIKERKKRHREKISNELNFNRLDRLQILKQLQSIKVSPGKFSRYLFK